MASATGMGTTVAFGTQTTFTPEITSVTHNGVTVGTIETTHLGTTSWKTFIPEDLKDGGELTMEGHFLGSQNPTLGGSAETITIDWSGSGDTWVGSGFITSFSPGAQIGPNLMTFTMTVKFTGQIQFNQ